MAAEIVEGIFSIFELIGTCLTNKYFWIIGVPLIVLLIWAIVMMANAEPEMACVIAEGVKICGEAVGD